MRSAHATRVTDSPLPPARRAVGITESPPVGAGAGVTHWVIDVSDPIAAEPSRGASPELREDGQRLGGAASGSSVPLSRDVSGSAGEWESVEGSESVYKKEFNQANGEINEAHGKGKQNVHAGHKRWQSFSGTDSTGRDEDSREKDDADSYSDYDRSGSYESEGEERRSRDKDYAENVGEHDDWERSVDEYSHSSREVEEGRTQPYKLSSGKDDPKVRQGSFRSSERSLREDDRSVVSGMEPDHNDGREKAHPQQVVGDLVFQGPGENNADVTNGDVFQTEDEKADKQTYPPMTLPKSPISRKASVILGQVGGQEPWTVHLNSMDKNLQEYKKHKLGKEQNLVTTSKYNVFNFLILNLSGQFSRLANVYFLIIAALQLLTPLSPTGQYSTAAPLSLVSMTLEFAEVHRHTCFLFCGSCTLNPNGSP